MSSMKMSSVAMQLHPRDELRQGLGSVRSDSQLAAHSVEQIQKTYSLQERANAKLLMARVYGQHLPIQRHMEEKILGQFQRFPGLPSSHLGLETLLGLDSEIEFGDYLNNEHDNERAIDARQAIEHRFGDAHASTLQRR